MVNLGRGAARAVRAVWTVLLLLLSSETRRVCCAAALGQGDRIGLSFRGALKGRLGCWSLRSWCASRLGMALFSNDGDGMEVDAFGSVWNLCTGSGHAASSSSWSTAAESRRCSLFLGHGTERDVGAGWTEVAALKVSLSFRLSPSARSGMSWSGKSSERGVGLGGGRRRDERRRRWCVGTAAGAVTARGVAGGGGGYIW